MVTIDGGCMETIARIPDVTVEPARRAAPPGGRAGARRRGPRFPLRSIAVLAALAAIAWTLVTWSEQERLRRQRQPLRLAREPAASVQESITP